MTSEIQKKLGIAFIAIMIALLLTIANSIFSNIGFGSIKLWLGTLIIFFAIYFFYSGSISVKIITVFLSILSVIAYLLFIIGLSVGLSIIISIIIIMFLFSFFLIG